MFDVVNHLFWLMILMIGGVGFAIKKLAQGNPGETNEIKKLAGAKAMSFVERLLK